MYYQMNKGKVFCNKKNTRTVSTIGLVMKLVAYV